MSLIAGLLLNCLFGYILADHTVHLSNAGIWSGEIKSPNYPQYPPEDYTEDKWEFTADAGKTIQVTCLDFRFIYEPEDECKYADMTFDDGSNQVKKCGTPHLFVVKTTTNKLTVQLTTRDRGYGVFDCRVKAVGTPQDVEQVLLDAGQGETEIKYPEVEGSGEIRAWQFSSKSGEPIYVKCDIRMERPLESGECPMDVLTTNNGRGPMEYCGYRAVDVRSKTGKITLTAEFFPSSTGEIQCVAGVEIAEDDPEAKVDSSEHGVAPGAKGTTCACGQANKDAGRMINGTATSEGEYPFMVSLRYYGTTGHFCGASIITPRHILTAAHCVSYSGIKDPPVPGRLGPVIGAHHYTQDASHGETKQLKVKEVHVHDAWFADKNSFVGDIAILELETPITYNKWVSPICLTSKPAPIVGKYVRAMGWGATEYGDPEQLLEADVLVKDTNTCHKDPKEVCFKAGPASSCFGDSGGPYVYVDPETNRYTQIGLVSYGYGECTGSIFIGTNTVYYYDWIQSIVKATSDENVCTKAD